MINAVCSHRSTVLIGCLLLFFLGLVPNTFAGEKSISTPLPLPQSDSPYFHAEHELSDAPEIFNYVDQYPWYVVISDLDIIIEPGHSNQIFETYNNRPDIRLFIICAENVEIRDHFRLPGTAVQIWCQNLSFTDPEGRISSLDTTPVILTDPAGEAGSQTPGAHGLNAGEIVIHIGSDSYTDTPGKKRFVADGGDGQPGALPLEGAPGESMDEYDGGLPASNTLPSGGVYVETQSYYGGPYTAIFGEQRFPTDGGDALPGGIPGNAGNAADINVNVDGFEEYAQLYPGLAPAPHDGALGGAPGEPVTARFLRHQAQVSGGYRWVVTNSRTQSAGASVGPTNGAAIEVGQFGVTNQIADPEHGFHPIMFQSLIKYADAMIAAGECDAMRERLQIYADYYDDSPWSDPLEEIFDYKYLRAQLQWRIDAPCGVPTLDFISPDNNTEFELTGVPTLVPIQLELTDNQDATLSVSFDYDGDEISDYTTEVATGSVVDLSLPFYSPGTYEIVATATDSDDQESNSDTRTIIIPEPPILITSLSPANGTVIESTSFPVNVPFTVVADHGLDEVMTLLIDINGDEVADTSGVLFDNQPLTLLASFPYAGDFQVTVEARDGNNVSSGLYTVNIQIVVPPLSLSWVDPDYDHAGFVWEDTPTTVSIDVQVDDSVTADATVSVDMDDDGSFEQDFLIPTGEPASITLSFPSEGIHQVRLRTTNSQGQAPASEVRTLHIGAGPPTLEITQPGDGFVIPMIVAPASAGVTFRLADPVYDELQLWVDIESDGTAEVDELIDIATNPRPGYFMDFPTTGTYLLEAWATEPETEQRSAPAKLTLYVDQNPPSVTVHVPQEGETYYYYDMPMEFFMDLTAFDDSGADMDVIVAAYLPSEVDSGSPKATETFFDNPSGGSGGGAFTLPNEGEDGAWALKVFALDKAGKRSEMQIIHFNVEQVFVNDAEHWTLY